MASNSSMSGRACVLALVMAAVLAGGTQACSPTRLGEAARVLADIDAGAGPSALKEQTPAPVRRPPRRPPMPSAHVFAVFLDRRAR